MSSYVEVKVTVVHLVWEIKVMIGVIGTEKHYVSVDILLTWETDKILEKKNVKKNCQVNQYNRDCVTRFYSTQTL